MKILTLRFKNLNSLKGEWLIDFTDKAFEESGLFAITGPTGSGKSTILDALCLALYGCTPRLKTLSKSTNEIMTRHTGECYAEAVFETHAETYLCHWSQHRARKKASGKLADTRHEISDYPSGAHLLTKKKETAQAVLERTGMDFDRFTRSILLAQGSFASFLKADITERADVLEQITGTGIYSEISVKVFENRRDAEIQLNEMKASISGIVVMDAEESALVAEQLSDWEEKEKKEASRAAQLGGSLNRLKQLGILKNNLLEIVQERQALDKEVEESENDRSHLKQAQLAAELEADYARITERQQQLKSDSEKLVQIRKTLPTLTEEIKKRKKEAEDASGLLEKTRLEGNRTLELIKETRAIDLKREERTRSATAQCRKIDGEERLIEENRKKLEVREQALVNLRNNSLKISSSLEQHQAHEILETELAGIREVIEQINGLSGQIDRKEKELIRLGTTQCQADEGLQRQISGLEELRVQHREMGDEGLRLKGRQFELLGGRDLKALKEDRGILQRKLNLIREIAGLEERRARLTEGSPCPLCGSLHHPYAGEETPRPNETEAELNQLTERIEALESLTEKIAAHEKQGHHMELLIKDSETEIKQWETKQSEAGEKQRNIREEREQLVGEVAEKQARVNSFTETLGLDLTTDYTQLLHDLEGLREKRRRDREQLETLKQGIQTGEQEKQNILGSLGSMAASLEEEKNVLKTLNEEREVLRQERSALFGDKDCVREEQRVQEALKTCEEGAKKSEEGLSSAVSKEKQARAQADDLETRTAEMKTRLDEEQQHFSREAEKRGFVDVQGFLSCRIAPEERERLSRRLTELDNRLISLEARRRDTEQRLKIEEEETQSNESEEILQKQLEEAEHNLRVQREERGALRQRLDADREARNRLREKAGEIEKQNREFQAWNNLNELIGSATGQKFQRFAQGLTFETMISHANRQLEKMTDRYLLIRDETAPLELNVVDNYQAGEIRSTKNLSGGESFIVSLALALGLSSMASRKVRVDSLFLDEGFGTLDEQSLETALETLSGLQQEGKLIGVISHVSALHESVGTRITVTPGTGGCSLITGPGVGIPGVRGDAASAIAKTEASSEQGLLF